MPSVHIHEDDEGMRNLYPVNASDEVFDDLSAAQQKAEINRTPAGAYTDVHLIEEPKVTYQEMGVKLAPVADAISGALPRIKTFAVGFGDNNPFRYSEEDAHCYGFGNRLYLKLDAEGDIIRRIWFDATSSDEEELRALRSALEAINALHPSMIADYWMHDGGLIDDTSFLGAYFDALHQSGLKVAASAANATVKLSLWGKLIVFLFGRQKR